MRQRPVLLAALFVSSLAACADEGEVATDSAALVFHQRDAQVIRGTFDHAGSVVTFDSRLVGPEHASLRLEVNQVVLTIDLDLGSGLIETDGGLGALYPEDTAALLALRDAIGAAAPELIDALHGRLLVRHADRMAEAPVGWTLDRQVFDLATLATDTVDRAGTCGNDGTTCLPGIGGYTYSYHDGVSHGCSASWDAYGNYASSCQGRCGAGCNWWFDDDMMQDCLDHDRCVDYHPGGGTGPGSADCGDEFNDASGDYVVTYVAYCPN